MFDYLRHDQLPQPSTDYKRCDLYRQLIFLKQAGRLINLELLRRRPIISAEEYRHLKAEQHCWQKQHRHCERAWIKLIGSRKSKQHRTKSNFF